MKISNELKVQIAMFLVMLGGGVQATTSMQKKVEALEKSNEQKTEIILRMEGKFDLLNLQIQQLKERLESKKIVATSMDESQAVSERIIER